MGDYGTETLSFKASLSFFLQFLQEIVRNKLYKEGEWMELVRDREMVIKKGNLRDLLGVEGKCSREWEME